MDSLLPIQLHLVQLQVSLKHKVARMLLKGCLDNTSVVVGAVTLEVFREVEVGWVAEAGARNWVGVMAAGLNREQQNSVYAKPSKQSGADMDNKLPRT